MLLSTDKIDSQYAGIDSAADTHCGCTVVPWADGRGQDIANMDFGMAQVRANNSSETYWQTIIGFGN